MKILKNHSGKAPAMAIMANLFALSACTSLPPMQDPKAYASMNCEALRNERTAVEANQNYHDENSKSGFWDVFGVVVEGLAMGTGNTTAATQQHATNAQREQMRTNSKDSADAYSQRLELLDKVSTVRKCT